MSTESAESVESAERESTLPSDSESSREVGESGRICSR